MSEEARINEIAQKAALWQLAAKQLGYEMSASEAISLAREEVKPTVKVNS